jgi:hypothetical protein
LQPVEGQLDQGQRRPACYHRTSPPTSPWCIDRAGANENGATSLPRLTGCSPTVNDMILFYVSFFQAQSSLTRKYRRVIFRGQDYLSTKRRFVKPLIKKK